MNQQDIKAIQVAFQESGWTIQKWSEETGVSVGTLHAIAHCRQKEYACGIIDRAGRPFNLECMVGPIRADGAEKKNKKKR